MALETPTGSRREDLSRIACPSEMVARPGLLMRRLVPMFERVTFDLDAQSRVKEAARRGPIVYVCERQSTIDYLYFNFAFLKFALPLVWFAGGVRTLLYRPLFTALAYWFRRLFRRRRAPAAPCAALEAGLSAGRATLLFLRPRRAILQWGRGAVTDHLKRLVELQAESDAPIQLVPLAVYWDKGPERHRRSFVDLIFGAHWAPGRLRKLIGFVRFHRNAVVQVAEPLDLPSFLVEHADDRSKPESLAEHLEYMLHRGLSQAARPLRGPVLKKARDMRDEILRNEAFKTALERHAQDTGKSVDAVRKAAAGYLKEMAANFSLRYVEGMCVAMAILWNRSFSGLDIDEEGLARIREAAREAPIILVPAHRSHIDYLAISWILYNHGLIPPHIAAGINLSFWPMGHIFRRSGAFFLRRSFKGNPLYAMTFQAYMRKLVKEGYWVEFFIEGGRSRTGKSLPPKLGMLSNFVEAVFDGATRDLYFVPVSIGSERVLEEGAYSRELSGAEKKNENLGAMLRASKVLGSKHGLLNARFHDPISLKQFVADKGLEAETSSAEGQRRITERFAHRLIEGINRSTVLTTMSLVATALLTHPKRGMSRERIGMRVGLLLDLADREGAPLARSLRLSLQARRQDLARVEENAEEIALERFVQDKGVRPAGPLPRYQVQRVIDAARGVAVAEAIDEALRWMSQRKQLRVHSFGDELVFTLNEDHRISLDMYKNGLIHHVVPPAFAATAILATAENGRVAARAVYRQVRFLGRLLKFEFELGERAGFDAAFERTRRLIEEMGFLLEVEDGGEEAQIHPKAYHLLRFFRNIIANFLESYWLVAHALPGCLENPQPRKDLLKRLQLEGARLYREGELKRREAISRVNFDNALQFYEERGFLTRDDKGRFTLARDARLFPRWERQIRKLLGSS